MARKAAPLLLLALFAASCYTFVAPPQVELPVQALSEHLAAAQPMDLDMGSSLNVSATIEAT